MNRLKDFLGKKPSDILSVYFTAGFPSLNDTTEIIKSLQNENADIIEIGIPFSDPMADGPVIQESNERAIKNGMNLDMLFDQLSKIRDDITIPLVIMSYFNPVFKYGVDHFCRKCNNSGISGLIIPDLPFEEYSEKYLRMYKENDLCYIPLITDKTNDERIKMLSDAADGFLYIVSSSIITGGKTDVGVNREYYSHIRELVPQKPFLIGFGIQDSTAFSNACRNADGAIVGTAFIRALTQNEGDVCKKTKKFVKDIRGK